MGEHVYILIRTKHSFILPKLRSKKLRFCREALESVARQSHDNISLIILQDSWYRLKRAPKKARLPHFCKEILKNRANKGTTHFYTSNSKGAAHALYNIRKLFLELTKKEKEAIAIMLDDDDLLTSSHSVEDIVERMGGENHICVSRFELCGNKALNIINKGGGAHNKLISRNSGGKLTPQTEEPFGRGSIAFADSLGWTKSYKREVVEEYHNDLKGYFGTEKKLVKFLKRNDAFEDFPEIINLCRERYSVVGVDKPTHTYRKHSGSITATPKKSDFKNKRPKYLSLLVGLYENLKNEKKLAAGSDMVIGRYCLIKILIIENIMAKFRSDGKIRRWINRTANGDFLEQFINITEQQGTLPTLLDLCEATMENKQAKANNYNDSTRALIVAACENEVAKHCVDIINCSRDGSNRFLRRRDERRRIYYIIYSVLGVMLVAMAIILLIKTGGAIEMWGVVVTALTAIGGWVWSRVDKIRTTEHDDEQLTTMFSDAIKELHRHLIVGFDLMWKIKERMIHQKDYIPAKVHFTNLKVSQHSLLLSDQMDSHIIVEEFKDLPHLRVNIRNINNTADYIEHLLESPNYSRERLIDTLEWELARYVGYIANFMYFNEQKGFSYPSSLNNLDIYVRSQDILSKIASKVKLSPKVDKEAEISRYYEAYLSDRSKERKII